MPIERYVNSTIRSGNINSKIYRAVQNNEIPYKTYVTKSGDRLDHISFREYDDALNWWVIAAASGIGWWLQVPEGISLSIPVNLEDIERIRSESQ